MFKNDGIVECAIPLRKFPYFALECTYRYHLATGLECYVRHCLNGFVDFFHSIEAAFLHFGDLESTGRLSLLYLKLCKWFYI